MHQATVNMLKAVSRMLEVEKPEEMVVQIRCAKLMLDGIIEGLADVQISEAPTPVLLDAVSTHPAKVKNLEPERLIMLNDDRTLKIIKNYPMSGRVDLDGTIMTHQEALGKKFSKGRMID